MTKWLSTNNSFTTKIIIIENIPQVTSSNRRIVTSLPSLRDVFKPKNCKCPYETYVHVKQYNIILPSMDITHVGCEVNLYPYETQMTTKMLLSQ